MSQYQEYAQQNTAMQTIQIVKLLLQETGTYNPMFSRPYQTYMDGQTLGNISDRINSSTAGSITGSLLSGLATNMLTPSATPQGTIPIPYGWTERRIRFLMEVNVVTRTGSTFIYYFQGYTSHLGVGHNGSIDPTMEFIINSYIRVTRANQYTPYGIQSRDIVTESAHIINGNIVQQSVTVDMFSMRPQDIFTGIQSSYLNSAYNTHSNNMVLNDTRVKFTGDTIRSNRSNNLASNFIAKVVDDYRTGVKLAEFGQNDTDIMARCRDLSYESSAFENIFIRAISTIKGVGTSTTFTFNILERLDPNVAAVTNYISLGATKISQLHQTGQTAYWGSSDRETLVATILSNSIPAIMMDLMISKIYFRSTNHDYSGQMNTVIIDAKSLTNIDLTNNFELFKRRLEKEILYDITYGNQDIYMLDMNVDLFGDTTINISIGNNPPILYTTPSFCDGLLTPVVTTNKDNFFNVVHDFEVLMNNISESTANRSASNFINDTI